MDQTQKTRLAVLPLLVSTIDESMSDLARDWGTAPASPGSSDRLCATLHRLRGGAGLLEVTWMHDLLADMEAAARRVRAGLAPTPEDAQVFATGLATLAAWLKDPRIDTTPASVLTSGPAAPPPAKRLPRTEIALRVDYDDAEQLVADYITDLGEGGLFLCTGLPFEIGQEITFSISLPRVIEPMPLRGVVRWRRTRLDAPDRLPGVGVEFVFTDAGGQEELKRLLQRVRAEVNAPAVARTAPFRVLLVEDNPVAHKLFDHALRRFHRAGEGPPLAVMSAYDGQQALHLVETSDIDLAIVDFFLPVLPGDQVVQRMRADPRHRRTPILMISVGGEGVRTRALQAGADLYIDKPVLLKQLINTLRLLIHNPTQPRVMS
jgi:uncharacterized protein (TIGR02266 family)